MYQRVVTNQRGAMFGLDARVALAIFGIISVVVGTAIFGNMGDFNARAFAKELREMHVAIEGLHTDLQTNVRNRLVTVNDTNAFAALYDRDLLTAVGQQRWLGPYINHRSTTHPLYGAMQLQRRAAANAPATACTATDGTCYMYLRYAAVPDNIIQALDQQFDGGDGAIAGQVQWTVTAGNNDILFFRTIKNMR
jgi:hypothetical protein